MLKASVLNWENKKVEEINIPKELFQVEIKKELINEVIRWQRACARQGTHKAKTRGEVSGGGKKPFRQKGTGNARQGSIRSPLNRTGGVTFGPKPRSYKYALPIKVRKAALRQTLSWLWEQKKIYFLEDMLSTEGKTKDLSSRLKNFKLKKALLVDKDINSLFKRACTNLKYFQIMSVEGVNVYDLLRYGNLMISKKSLPFLIQKCKKGES